MRKTTFLKNILSCSAAFAYVFLQMPENAGEIRRFCWHEGALKNRGELLLHSQAL